MLHSAFVKFVILFIFIYYAYLYVSCSTLKEKTQHFPAVRDVLAGGFHKVCREIFVIFIGMVPLMCVHVSCYEIP